MPNNITIVGRLGKDAERKTAGNTPLLEFSVGENVGFGDKQVTNWWKCALWGKQAEGSLAQYLVKGAQVVVFGEVTQRKYTSANGDGVSLDIRVQSVQLVGEKQSGSGQTSTQPAQYQQQRTGNGQTLNQGFAAHPADTDDDLPF
ncbi:MAG: single-stranded DNA-binding protein [Moraxellaceae bacterium]